jgi:hypothetical protein
MKRKSFCGTHQAAKAACWLYMIWLITSMWTSLDDLRDWGSEKILMDQTILTLTRIFKEGSASARRPAVTQAAAPPDPIVSTTAAQIEK